MRWTAAAGAIAVAGAVGSIGCASSPAGPRAAAPTRSAERAACDAGDAAACVRAARPLAERAASAEESALAFQLYDRACALHSEEGCLGLADLYGVGRGVGRDPEKALAILRASCARASPQGCSELGLLLLTGAYGQKDEAAARALCLDGPPRVSADWCVVLGNAVETGMTSGGLELMGRAFQRACDGGKPGGCVAASLILFEAARRTEGVALAQRQCDEGNQNACTALRQMQGIMAREKREGGGDAPPAPVHLRVPAERLSYDPPDDNWGTFVPTHEGGPTQTVWRWWRSSYQIEVSSLAGVRLPGAAIEPLARGTAARLAAGAPISAAADMLAGKPATHLWFSNSGAGRCDFFFVLFDQRLYTLLVIQQNGFNAPFLERAKAGLNLGD